MLGWAQEPFSVGGESGDCVGLKLTNIWLLQEIDAANVIKPSFLFLLLIIWCGFGSVSLLD